MVLVEKKDGCDYLISLSPNSSLVGFQRILFLASITLVCGGICLLYTSPSPRDRYISRMPSSA